VDRTEGTFLEDYFTFPSRHLMRDHLAIPGSTDRVDRLRDTKCTVWRAKSNAIADAERTPDADHHDRIEHRRGLS
jgi:hypothetical protein